MAVGDGANDLPMLMYHQHAGIALNAKPKVSQLAPHSLTMSNVLGLVFLLDPYNEGGQFLRNSI